MSFSSEVKEELAEHMPHARHCQIAELTALLLTTGGGDAPFVAIRTENYRVARKADQLIRRLFHIACEVRVRSGAEHTAPTLYETAVPDRRQAARVLQVCKLQAARELNRLIVQQTCCKRAFLRGVFLTSGSVNNPEKSYHFEMACADMQTAETVRELLRSFGPEARIVRRKRSYVVYLKEGETIVDALNIMGAHRALMNMENIRIWKDVRNQTNRKVNCDLANIHKTLTAAQRQLEDIRCIERLGGFRSLSPELRQTAELRLQEPELSLQELGELLNPPVSKSGVNHRLKKLSGIADKLREKVDLTEPG